MAWHVDCCLIWGSTLCIRTVEFAVPKIQIVGVMVRRWVKCGLAAKYILDFDQAWIGFQEILILGSM